jgi:hypothetical protein
MCLCGGEDRVYESKPLRIKYCWLPEDWLYAIREEAIQISENGEDKKNKDIRDGDIEPFVIIYIIRDSINKV